MLSIVGAELHVVLDFNPDSCVSVVSEECHPSLSITPLILNLGVSDLIVN